MLTFVAFEEVGYPDWVALSRAEEDVYVIAQWRRGEAAPTLVEHRAMVRQITMELRRRCASSNSETIEAFFARDDRDGRLFGVANAHSEAWLPYYAEPGMQ